MGVVLAAVLLPLLLACCTSSSLQCKPSLECCRFPPDSREFRGCCEDCCPQCQNVYYDAALNSVIRAVDCEAAYECCVYRIFSKEWVECCSRHKCCPFCHNMPKGCCYGNTLYMWGTVVENLPDLNTDLVCGAKLYNNSPYFSAKIVPIQQPLPANKDRCAQSCDSDCVEHNGIIRGDGTEWFRTPCSLCVCQSGRIDCRPIEPKCPSAPHHLCRPGPPGECCSTWDCSSLYGRELNVDCLHAGMRHQAGEEWWDQEDPCIFHRCLEAGRVESVRRDCPRPPRILPPGCRLVTRPGECCHSLECSDECPDPNSFNINCVQFFDQCQSDEECNSDARCCLVAGCGKECMIVSKPGECPVFQSIVAPGPCNSSLVDSCQVDQQCLGRRKCCLIHCTKECVDPLPEVSKPGECPVLQHIVAPGPCDPALVNSCQVDQQCPGHQKCCFLDCTKECTDPLIT